MRAVRMTDPGPPRKARRDLESPEMKALFHWANLQTCVYPELLYLYAPLERCAIPSQRPS